MAGASFSMDTSALDGLVKGMVQKVKDRQELMEAIGETLVSSTIDRFDQGKAPDGTSWPASQRALGEGAKSGKMGKTLVDSGQLMGSIAYEASTNMVAVGSNKVYARVHQHGGKAGRSRKVSIPKRSYLGISEEDRKEIRGLIQDYLELEGR